MDELQVSVIQTPGEIKCNFDELKENLALQMTAYKDLEITEDNIPESKKDLATLRKIKKAVDDERKKVKAEFNKPYAEFEGKVKELLAIIDEPISMIDGKIKEFDEKAKEEKRAHIEELYKEHIREFEDFLSLDDIKKPEWENKTYSDKDIIYDISEAVTKVRSELDAIKALNSEIEEECIKAYKKSGRSLAAAITKNSDYMAAKQMAQAKLAEEKIQEEATKAAQKAEALKNEIEAKQADEEVVILEIKKADQKEVTDFLDFQGTWYRVRE